MATFLFYENSGVVFEKRGHYSGFWGHVILTWYIIGDFGTGGMKRRGKLFVFVCFFIWEMRSLFVVCLSEP